MNEQTNECKNTKKHYTFSPPAGEGGGTLPPRRPHVYIYSKKIYNLSLKILLSFLTPPEFSRHVLEKN
jgi:hypothetical protein